MKFMFAMLFLTELFSCASPDQTSRNAEVPENIIFLIGDGMGLSAVSTTFYFGEQKSVFSQFEEFGFIITSSATHKITDSGASGTAMAAGIKTYNGAIGMDTSKIKVSNITELVSDAGWSTGVIATSSITHATPASFYAHVEQRSMEEEIAIQLLDSEIDFFAGGGTGYFNRRHDGGDLFRVAVEKGFTLDTTGLTESGSLSPDQKYGFLLSPGGLPSMTNGRGDFLLEATELAIEYLSGKGQGFFLMVEGSQIDWAGHSNNGDQLVAEVLDFQKAIEAALNFAKKDGRTLVVVTADHETGGLTLSGKQDQMANYSDYNIIEPAFATSGHSTTLIPVFAFGPGAGAFNGIYENTELFHKMVAAARMEP